MLVAALCATVLVTSFVAIAWSVVHAGAMVALDQHVAVWVRGWDAPTLLGVLAAVSALHVPRGILALTAIAAAVLLLRRDRVALATLLVSVLGGAALNHWLKHSFMRTRPGLEALVGVATDFSFPSGHVANATLLYGTLVAIVFSRSRNRWLRCGALLTAAAMVGLVALSRITLGVHHFSDVAAGLLLGLAVVALGALALSIRPAAPGAPP